MVTASGVSWGADERGDSVLPDLEGRVAVFGQEQRKANFALGQTPPVAFLVRPVRLRMVLHF